jgi:hypothetical protein
MMSFLEELKDWTDCDAAALALGRALGVFSEATQLTDAKAVLWTNGAAGNTLYGMLERLAWLGVLEHDEEQKRYRSASPTLHPLGEVDDVPALAAGPPGRAHLEMSLESPEGFRLEADRPGFRYLARVFEEIASSGVESGWHFERDEHFHRSSGAPHFTFALREPEAE